MPNPKKRIALRHLLVIRAGLLHDPVYQLDHIKFFPLVIPERVDDAFGKRAVFAWLSIIYFFIMPTGTQAPSGKGCLPTPEWQHQSVAFLAQTRSRKNRNLILIRCGEI
jgi:hypothetical protein